MRVPHRPRRDALADRARGGERTSPSAGSAARSSSVTQRIKAAIRLRLRPPPGCTFSALALERLPLHFSGNRRRRGARCTSCAVVGARRAGAAGDARARWLAFLPASAIRPLGFSRRRGAAAGAGALVPGLPAAAGVLRLPAALRFFELGGLQTRLSNVPRATSSSRGAPRARRRRRSRASSTPRTSRCSARRRSTCSRSAPTASTSRTAYEYHVVPDRTRPLDFEVYDVTEVSGYAASGTRSSTSAVLRVVDAGRRAPKRYYTMRREPRMHVGEAEAPGHADQLRRHRSLHVAGRPARRAVPPSAHAALGRAPCARTATCRSLMPAGGQSDFALDRGGAGARACAVLGGPTRPVEPLLDGARRLALHQPSVAQLPLARPTSTRAGRRGGAARAARALRRDARTSAARRQIEGIRSVRVAADHAAHARRAVRSSFGRGLEITLTMRRARFEGSGAFLLGAVLEQFFARHVVDQLVHRNVLDVLEPRRNRCGGRHGSAQRPTSSRRSSRRLAGRAAAAFDFFQALRRIEAAHPGSARASATRAARCDEPVRFGQEPSLAFAPAPLASFEPATGVPPRAPGAARASACSGPTARCRSTSPSTRASGRAITAIPTFVRFLDVFHHRLLALFYRAWAQAQPPVSLDRPRQDRFARLRRALCRPGLAVASRPRRVARPGEALRTSARCSGARCATPKDCEAILRELLPACRCEIEEFVGHWLTLAPEQHTRLGARGASPGWATTRWSAAHVWDRAEQVPRRARPADLARYERFLPRRAKPARALRRLGAAVPRLRARLGGEAGADAAGGAARVARQPVRVGWTPGSELGPTGMPPTVRPRRPAAAALDCSRGRMSAPRSGGEPPPSGAPIRRCNRVE